MSNVWSLERERHGPPRAHRLDPDWAWSPYQPDGSRPWSLRLAGHLFRRAAFGATWRQLQTALREGPAATVERLLRPQDDLASFQRRFDQFDDAVARSGSTSGLRSWWLRRMLETPHPLLEKVTLFWHSHFAVSDRVVRDARLMKDHVHTLRRHALGSYADLLRSLTRDAATLVGLGAEANRKLRPSHALARQFLDRYTLGPGRATADDVDGVARAFTGWFVLRGALRFFPSERDSRAKVIRGRRGDFDPAAAVDVLLEDPATPLWVVRNVYRWFVSEVDEPSDELLRPLADQFGRDYDVARLLRRILLSNLFYSQAAHLRRVKSPVEFALSVAVPLEGLVPTEPLGAWLARLGQDLYRPPAEEGWAGGTHWVTPASLVARNNLAHWLLTVGQNEPKLSPWSVAQRAGRSTVEAAAEMLLDLLLPDGLTPQTRARLLEQTVADARRHGTDTATRLLVHRLSALPEFQLA